MAGDTRSSKHAFPTYAAQLGRRLRADIEGSAGRLRPGRHAVAATLRLRVAEGTGSLARTEPVPARPERLTERAGRSRLGPLPVDPLSSAASAVGWIECP